MIVYLDTSSLVKLYVEENGSADVAVLIKSSDVVATSLIAYAEARAAFARKFREEAFTSKEYNRLLTSFNKDWDSYLVVKVTKDLVRMAGDLAERYALRGYDAIHLASSMTLQQELSSPIIFSCFDKNLQKASERENLGQP
jgi:predicted nucleic acid-binding protein